MDQTPHNIRRLVIRLLPALILLAMAWYLLNNASQGVRLVYGLAFGFSALIAAAIIIAFPLAGLLSEPVGNLFYPTKRAKGPTPVYSIPKAQRAKGLHDDAIASLQKLAADFPNEPKAWIEMIDIAIVDLKDVDLAREFYESGLSRLKNESDKAFLSTRYSQIKSLMRSKVSN